jgi:hypothetical protein
MASSMVEWIGTRRFDAVISRYRHNHTDTRMTPVGTHVKQRWCQPGNQKAAFCSRLTRSLEHEAMAGFERHLWAQPLTPILGNVSWSRESARECRR